MRPVTIYSGFYFDRFSPPVVRQTGAELKSLQLGGKMEPGLLTLSSSVSLIDRTELTLLFFCPVLLPSYAKIILRWEHFVHVWAYFVFLLTGGVPIAVMLSPGMVLCRRRHIKETPRDSSEMSLQEPRWRLSAENLWRRRLSQWIFTDLQSQETRDTPSSLKNGAGMIFHIQPEIPGLIFGCNFRGDKDTDKEDVSSFNWTKCKLNSSTQQPTWVRHTQEAEAEKKKRVMSLGNQWTADSSKSKSWKSITRFIKQRLTPKAEKRGGSITASLQTLWE